MDWNDSSSIVAVEIRTESSDKKMSLKLIWEDGDDDDWFWLEYDGMLIGLKGWVCGSTFFHQKNSLTFGSVGSK